MTLGQPSYIACDLGAESGRVMLGTLGDGQLTVEEIHRFSNDLVKVHGGIRWDLLRIFGELKKGLAMVAERGVEVCSLSVDSWGVDYVLLGDGQPMLSPARHYRDPRNEANAADIVARIGRERIFDETGIQFIPFNTIVQLCMEVEESPKLLGIAERLLMVGDYMNYLFCGVGRAERSLASTSQLYNPRTHEWSDPLIEAVGVRRGIFPGIVPSGTRLGPLLPEVAEETGLRGVEVVATCSHDTGAAVAAVPAGEGGNWAYLSSGTWSLIGVELDEPLVNDKVAELNYTNEVGYGGSIRFLKNIVGLWIVQESKRHWERAGESHTYDELEKLAAGAAPLESLINPNAARFLSPGEMPEKVRSYCRETGQPEPATTGALMRCVFESLALLYHRVLADIEGMTGRRIDTLHIVGGGSKNLLLDQFAADATGREVVAGPAEATAIGNILIQALSMGQLGSLAELRACVRSSVPLRRFQPSGADVWQAARERFNKLDSAL